MCNLEIPPIIFLHLKLRCDVTWVKQSDQDDLSGVQHGNVDLLPLLLQDRGHREAKVPRQQSSLVPATIG